MNTEKDSNYKEFLKTDFESNGKIVLSKNKTVKQIFQDNFIPILIVFFAVFLLIVAILVVFNSNSNRDDVYVLSESQKEAAQEIEKIQKDYNTYRDSKKKAISEVQSDFDYY